MFSFLDHSNLCKAARVCRQWRAASAHEDFWKFLNFEDRNITVQQCEPEYTNVVMIILKFYLIESFLKFN